MQTRILYDEVADYMRAQAQAEHQETMLLIAAIIVIAVVALVLMFLYIPRNEQLLKERREREDMKEQKDFAQANWGDAEQRVNDMRREVEKVKAEAEEKTAAAIRRCNIELSKQRKRAEREAERARLFAELFDMYKTAVGNMAAETKDPDLYLKIMNRLKTLNNEDKDEVAAA